MTEETRGERIETAGELDALPAGSVILDLDGLVLQRHPILGWRTFGQYDIEADTVIRDGAPLTVVHRPDRDLIAEAEERGAREALLSAADSAFQYGSLREFSYWLRARAEQTGGADG